MRLVSVLFVVLIPALLTCSNNQASGGATMQASATTQQERSLPAGAADASTRLAASPRHGEWVVVRSGADSIRAWLVYPERSTPAPVVVVVHEIFGLSNWVRAVADQLAADGFIAIAPDLLTMKNIPNTLQGEPNPDSARAAIRTLQAADYQRHIRLVAEHAMALPAAAKTYGVVGYCWGGAAVFDHAVVYPDVGAVVSYYGTTPTPENLPKVKAPVLGLYGQDDERVNSTIARADAALGDNYQYHIFPGAGHGFLRAQDGRDANLAATKQAWPLTVQWFRRHLRS